jgi:hypothetical protein
MAHALIRFYGCHLNTFVAAGTITKLAKLFVDYSFLQY